MTTQRLTGAGAFGSDSCTWSCINPGRHRWSIGAMLLLLRASFTLAYVKPEIKEYCQFETFNATCPRDEVVVIDTAMYGRMKVGRCATMELGSRKCAKDVRAYLETLCSGKRSCKFEVPDKTLKAMKPCPTDFAPYIAASYFCVPVQTGGNATCSGHHRLQVPASPGGFLASTLTDRSGRGSAQCPWHLKARHGQRINITLLDFMAPYKHNPNDVTHQNQGHSLGTHCQKYAVIRERSPTRDLSTVVCGGEARERTLYVSTTNEVDIEIIKFNAPKKVVSQFMLEYKAIGCADYPVPRNGWMQRDGDVTFIGCNDTDGARWKLECVGSGWVGQAHNCTLAPESEHNVWTILSDDWSSPIGILIVSAMGILLGLLIGAALLAIVLVFVQRNKTTCLGPPSDYQETAQDVGDERSGGTYVIQNKRNSVTALMDQYELSNIADNYGATWRAHAQQCNQVDHDVTTTRFVTPIVTCSASITDTNGSPCHAPDVTCVVRKPGQSPATKSRGLDPHLYEAPFIGRDLQLHTLTTRDG